MKRLIALVLSLIMALSLCVPAWGATASAATADELVEALEGGNDVVMTDNIEIDPAKMSNAYGKTGIVIKNGQVLDGNNKILAVKGANNTWDSGVCVIDGTLKNVTVTDSFRGIFIRNNTQKVFLENVTTQGTVYTISVDQGGGGGLEATNCTFNGWTSFAATLGNAVFTNCSFGEGSGYAFCRPYATTTFVGCDFAEGYELGAQADVYFDNCTLGGEPLTTEDLADFVVENPGKAKVLSSAAVPEVEVEVAAPDVDINDALTGDDKAAAEVIAATGGVTLDDTALTEVAEVVATNTEVSEAEAVKALVDAGHSTAGATVVVEPYFDVVVEDVDVANATITLDITPMYQVVATNGTDKVDIGQPQEMTIPEGKSVEIKVQIPDALAANGKLYVTHDGAEIYEATVTGIPGAYFATFTTTSGFSPYVFSLTPPAVVAVVNGVNYANLQAAIDAAPAGATVKLMADNADDVTVGKNVTIYDNGYSYTGTMTAVAGFAVVSDGNGNYTTIPSSFTKYTLWDSQIAATATGVNYIATDLQLPVATKAVAPTATNPAGTVAYYTVDGSKYVQGTAADCDIYYTVAGKTTPVLYLKQIGNEMYYAAATEFTNFGKACGQCDFTPAANTKYYTYTDLAGNVYVHAEDTSAGAMANSAYFLLVNGKMVPIVPTNVYNEVEHTWTFTRDAKGTPVSAKCEDCGVTAKVYSKFTAVPTGADYIREGAYFLVINAPAANGKVESAETFDAGIAMYVGMSVMAAAGSAVVLKKKD